MKSRTLALSALLALAVAGIAGLAHARAQMLATTDAGAALAVASHRLALDADQQAQLRPLLERAFRLRAATRADAEAVIAASRAELARPDANLRALSAERQAIVDGRVREARQLRDDLIAFYEDTLTPAQQAEARGQLLDRIDRIESAVLRLQALRGEPLLGP